MDLCDVEEESETQNTQKFDSRSWNRSSLLRMLADMSSTVLCEAAGTSDHS